MLAVAAAGASHPAVAALLGLGAVGLGGAVVAMAWSVHTHQMRLAEHLARRQYLVTSAAAGTAAEQASPEAAVPEARASNGARPRLTIEGPETVVAGEQARFRVRPPGSAQQVVTWAAGGGAVSQAPDPAHPDELLLVADEPGNLMVSVRVREGLTERRETKAVTAVPDVTNVAPPFTLRLFLHGWGLVVVAVLIIGFAGALVALGSLTSSDFIALVVPLAALLGVIAVVRGQPASEPGVTVSPTGPRFRRRNLQPESGAENLGSFRSAQ